MGNKCYTVCAQSGVTIIKLGAIASIKLSSAALMIKVVSMRLEYTVMLTVIIK